MQGSYTFEKLNALTENLKAIFSNEKHKLLHDGSTYQTRGTIVQYLRDVTFALAIFMRFDAIFTRFKAHSRFSLSFMAEWLREWDTLAMMKLWRREVVSSIPDRGTIVG